jgi:hypothetical protein
MHDGQKPVYVMPDVVGSAIMNRLKKLFKSKSAWLLVDDLW